MGSDWSTKNSYGEKIEIHCECGTNFEVTYAKQTGHNEKEEFYCPDCNKEFSVRAAYPIKTSDIKKMNPR